MKTETIKEQAERLLAHGKGVLQRCKTIEAKKRIKRHNKYLMEVIKLGNEYQKQYK